MVDFLADPFSSSEAQRAWLELTLIAVPAGTLGAFVVIRRLAFATHALGVGAFPGTIVALGLGFSTFAGGLAAALVFAMLLAALEHRRELDVAAATGLLLAGALALGAVLASDVFPLGEHDPDVVLFGPSLGASTIELVRAGLVAVLAAAVSLTLGRGWLVVAFDRENAPAFGFRAEPLDAALFATLAVAVVAAVDAVGALLVSSLFVVPAGTARLFAKRLLPLAVASSVLALAAGTSGLWLAGHVPAPQGACVAAVAAAIFIGAIAVRTVEERRHARNLVETGAHA